MRLQLILALLCAPCLSHGFVIALRQVIASDPSRAIASPRRCVVQHNMMTLPPICSDKSVEKAFRFAGAVVLGGSLLMGVVSGSDIARADVLISPRCITGEGGQCDDLAEGNELIKSLQAKSALTKEKYVRETLDEYNEHNFKDYFRAENKHMVRKKNGKYEILTNEEYTAAERAGKVKKDVFIIEPPSTAAEEPSSAD